MKLLNYSLAAVMALSFVVAPLSAQAQSRDSDRKPAVQSSQKQAQKAPVKKKWARGQKVSDWKSRPQVKDYKRYGLAAPGKGQQWVKVDNDYLLVTLATGIIVSIANSQ